MVPRAGRKPEGPVPHAQPPASRGWSAVGDVEAVEGGGGAGQPGDGVDGDVAVALPVAGDGADGLLGAAVDADADVALVGVLLSVDRDPGAGEGQGGGRSVGGGVVDVVVVVAVPAVGGVAEPAVEDRRIGVVEPCAGGDGGDVEAVEGGVGAGQLGDDDGVVARGQPGDGVDGDVAVALPVAGQGADGLLGAAVDADADVALVGVLLSVDRDPGAGEGQPGGG